MKIIIVESELYLAQSIAAKLSEHNFETEIYSSFKDAMESEGDAYLLSMSITGQSCLPVIDKFKDKIIILMVNYINNDTVGEPIQHGARDYIVKPFMIEDLLRKIEHHRTVCLLEKQTAFYERYLGQMFDEIDHGLSVDKLPLPVIVHTNYQRAADKFAIEAAKALHMPPVFISLEEEGWEAEIDRLGTQELGYIVHVETLRKKELTDLFARVQDKQCILTTLNPLDEPPYEVLTIATTNKLFDPNEVLTIDEYVQHVVKSLQYKLPDTTLSKKLGISRKSLWEKRKKYDLFKKK
jgi:response regulator of citrate/malate metabolism